MKIPIKIKVQDNSHHDFQKALLGLVDIVHPEKLKGVKEFEGKEIRWVNESAIITEGITISRDQSKEKKTVEESYVPVEVIDYDFIIEIAEKLLSLATNGYVIADWIWNKAKGHNGFKLFVKDKEISSKEEFQKTR